MNSYSCCFSSTYVTTYPSFLFGPHSSSSSSSNTNLRRPGCGEKGVDRTTSCLLGVSCSPFDGSSQNPRLLLIFPNGAKEKGRPNRIFFSFTKGIHCCSIEFLKDNPNGPTLLPPMSHPRCPTCGKNKFVFCLAATLSTNNNNYNNKSLPPQNPPKKNRNLIIQPSRKEKKSTILSRAWGGGKIQE